DVGDEPLLLAAIAPTLVARDRVRGAAAAVAAGAGLIVMDDGFQNPWLAKDLSLVVLDGERGIGNGRVIPAGPLRAPLDAQLARAHALVMIGTSVHEPQIERDASTRKLPVFRARLQPDAGVASNLAGRRVLAFAGIGEPDKF